MTHLIDIPVAYEQNTHADKRFWMDHLESAFETVSSCAESQEEQPLAPMPETQTLPAENAGMVDSQEMRYEKIAALKAAIANGTYHVSAEALADRLIESLLS